MAGMCHNLAASRKLTVYRDIDFQTLLAKAATRSERKLPKKVF